jgi:hypothetical protein
MAITTRPRPVISGKDKEGFLQREKENNLKRREFVKRMIEKDRLLRDIDESISKIDQVDQRGIVYI